MIFGSNSLWTVVSIEMSSELAHPPPLPSLHSTSWLVALVHWYVAEAQKEVTTCSCLSPRLTSTCPFAVCVCVYVCVCTHVSCWSSPPTLSCSCWCWSETICSCSCASLLVCSKQKNVTNSYSRLQQHHQWELHSIFKNWITMFVTLPPPPSSSSWDCFSPDALRGSAAVCPCSWLPQHVLQMPYEHCLAPPTHQKILINYYQLVASTSYKRVKAIIHYHNIHRKITLLPIVVPGVSNIQV